MHSVTLCLQYLKLRLMNWKESLLDCPSGLKMTFSFYECLQLLGYCNLFKIEKNREELRVSRCSFWFFLVTIFAVFVKVKDLPRPFGGWLYRVLTWLDILTPLALVKWILCTALYGRNWFFLSLPRSSQAHVPPLPASHLQVASWSDKLKQSRGCWSLNQNSLHAFSASAPFFLQKQRKQPELPTCQEEMIHRQPKGFSMAMLQGHWHKMPVFIAALNLTHSSVSFH